MHLTVFLYGLLLLWPQNKLQMEALLNNGNILEHANMTQQKVQIHAPVCKHGPAFHAIKISSSKQQISLSDYL